MDNAVKLMDAIAKLGEAFAWPIAVLVLGLVALIKYKDAIVKLIDRMKEVKLPGLELIVAAATEPVIEAADRVVEASPDGREEAVQELAQAAEESRRMLARLLKSIAAEGGRGVVPSSIERAYISRLAELQDVDIAEIYFRRPRGDDDPPAPVGAKT